MSSDEEKDGIKILDILFGLIKFISIIFLILFICVVLFQKFTDSKTTFMGYRIFTVDGKSMSPDYKDGDVLLVERISSDVLIKGDDISYLNDDEDIVTERITEVIESEDGVSFVVAGINNDSESVIGEDQIYGKVTYKFIFISLLSKLASNMVTLIITIVVPLLIIIILNLKDILVKMKKSKVDKKQKQLAKRIEDNIEADLNSEDDDDNDEESQRMINKYYE